jgi:hypothetical protein
MNFKIRWRIRQGGIGTITVDGNKVGEGRIEKTQPGIFSVDDLADVGTDDGTPVDGLRWDRRNSTGTLKQADVQPP